MNKKDFNFIELRLVCKDCTEFNNCEIRIAGQEDNCIFVVKQIISSEYDIRSDE